jgi:hypothetical protein
MPELKGLLALPVRAKSSDKYDGQDGDGDEAPGSSDDVSMEDELLNEAFDAAHDKDRKAFRDAMKDAIRACVRAEQGGDYDDAKE